MGNVEALRAILAAFNDNDFETGRSLVHPDLSYTIRGHGPFAGTFRGLEEALGVLQGIRDATANTMTAEPEVIVSSEEHIMAYMRVHG